jgi:alpha-2-macroglobulin
LLRQFIQAKVVKVFWFFFSKKNRKKVFFLKKEAKTFATYPSFNADTCAAACSGLHVAISECRWGMIMKAWQVAAGAGAAVIVVALATLFSGPQQHARPPSAPSTQQATATAPEPAPRAPFTYQHLHLNTAGDAPEACFVFSAPLATAAEAHYGDYIKLTPPARTAVRVSGSELCLGALTFGTAYSAQIAQGLPAADGARLATAATVPIEFGDKPKLIDIAGDGFVLPRANARGLTIQTVNIRKLRVHVLRMSDRLLPARTGDRTGFSAGSLSTSYGSSYLNVQSLLADAVSLVWSGTMDIAEDHNHTVQTAFPLGNVIKPGQVGAYLVVAQDDAKAISEAKFRSAMGSRANGEEDYGGFTDWEGMAGHWVIATDLALTTYSGTDGLTVTARSLQSALPAAGVKLSLLAVGQDVLGEADTDSDGLAHFAPGLLRGEGAMAAGHIVAHGANDDFTLLDLGRPAFDFSDRGVTGRPSPAPLQAFLYTERGIYRPGQIVHAMALLRDRLGQAADAMPLTFVLRRPDGMEAKRFAVAAQPAAGFSQDIKLSPTAARGQWSIEALSDPAAPPLGHASFEVQDYVPQQLKVTIGHLPAFAAPGDQIVITAQGDFLYGAPAAGLHGEAELRVMADPDPVPDAKGFSFGLADEKADEKVTTVPLPPADAHGAAQANAKVEVTAGLQAPRKLIVSAGLFEPSGRIVTDKRELKLHIRPLLIGIRPRFDDFRTDESRDAPIDIRVFDAAGTPVARQGLRWRVIYESRTYDWFEAEGGGWHWHFHTHDVDIASGDLDVSADRPAAITRQYEWGDYRLVVEDPATGTASSVIFHAGWGNSTDQADIPDKVRVTADRATVGEGGVAHLRVSAPFAGHAQLVLANDRVIETRDFDVGRDGGEIEVKQSPEWGAGVYAMVTLYRPLGQGTAHAPVRAVGLTWIGADTTARTLNVSLTTPTQMRPQNDLAVAVHVANVTAGDHAFVTLAAVDEGILQLTRYQNPDPVGYLFGKRALGISMRDDYGKLLDSTGDPGRIQGGDEGLGGAGLPVVSTRTVAMFSGITTVDANGDATIHFPVPDFQGQVRLMAVAYSSSGVGQAFTSVIVRDPVVADISMPRFFATGDDSSLAVSLHDLDGPAGTYILHVTAGGAWSLAGPSPGKDTLHETLQPGERKSASIALHGDAEGVGTLAAELTGPAGLDVHRSWEISVRGPHFPITLQQAAWQNPGAGYTIDAGLLHAFVPGSTSVSLGYSGFEGIDVPSLLQSLYRYPYGCTEQLASTAFPLLYANDPLLLGHAKGDTAVHDRVQTAIDTILERQGADGQFGLWRADDYRASTWLNVYALDFLTHASDAGFLVEPNAMRLGLAWLERAARGDADEHVGTDTEASRDETKAYANYVLARIGRADIGELRRWHDTLQRHFFAAAWYWTGTRDLDVFEPLSLGHVAGALALMGDRVRAADTFDRAIGNLDYREYPTWWSYYLYTTPTRDIAGLLAIAAESDEPATVQRLLARLHTRQFNAAYFDTQTTAALLSAAHALNKAASDIPLNVNGARVTLGSTPALAPTPPEIAAGFSVRNDGDRPAWRTLSLSGVPAKSGPALAAGFRIEKTFFSLDGTKLDPTHVRQNDRMIIALHGTATDNASHRTVLVDMLPAGWEIENAVGTSNQYSFLGPISAARVREARDDRFVAAFDLGSDLNARPNYDESGDEKDKDKPTLNWNEFRVAYVARAITPGHFTLPEAVVQDMYQAQIMGRTVSGTTEVKAR